MVYSLDFEIWAILFAFLTCILCHFFFHAMEFGNIFWKIRYFLAKYYANKDGGNSPKILNDIITQALEAQYDDQASIANEAYKYIAQRQLMFTRWICPVCFSGFVSVLAGGLGGIYISATVSLLCGFEFFIFQFAFVYLFTIILNRIVP